MCTSGLFENISHVSFNKCFCSNTLQISLNCYKPLQQTSTDCSWMIVSNRVFHCVCYIAIEANCYLFVRSSYCSINRVTISKCYWHLQYNCIIEYTDDDHHHLTPFEMVLLVFRRRFCFHNIFIESWWFSWTTSKLFCSIFSYGGCHIDSLPFLIVLIESTENVHFWLWIEALSLNLKHTLS